MHFSFFIFLVSISTKLQVFLLRFINAIVKTCKRSVKVAWMAISIWSRTETKRWEETIGLAAPQQKVSVCGSSASATQSYFSGALIPWKTKSIG